MLTDDAGEQLTVDKLPPPATTQWQTGTLTVTAADGSTLVLSPATDDSATFSVAIGDEADPIDRAWSGGFQVSCPQPIECR